MGGTRDRGRPLTERDFGSELFARAKRRYPDAMQMFFDWCWEHEDSIYSWGEMAGPAPEEGM